jgi:hypothetical protein
LSTQVQHLTVVVVLQLCILSSPANIDMQYMSSKMKKIRNSQRYTNLPIPSTRHSKVPIPEVESSPLHDYKSYPMPDSLWRRLISVYKESRTVTGGNTTCFDVLPATEEELSLFPTGFSNHDLREFFFKKKSSTRKMDDGWDYRERSIQSEPTSGASMYKPTLCYDSQNMALLSVRTLFTSDSIQALNQVCHVSFIYAYL